MNTLQQWFQGRKTYLTCVTVGVLLFGSWQGWWRLPAEIYAGLAAMAAAFLRAGIANLQGPPPTGSAGIPAGDPPPPAPPAAPAGTPAQAAGPEIQRFSRLCSGTLSQSGHMGDKVEDKVKDKDGNSAAVRWTGAGLLAGLLLAGCGSLDTAGVYHGDKALYQADFALVTSYDTLHSFVRWEYEHRAALSATPAIRAAADRIRSGAPQWFSSALALRDACQANPTAANYAALERAMTVIHQAVLEAMKYLTMDNGAVGSPLSRLTEPESAVRRPVLVPAPSNQGADFNQL